MDYNFRYSKQIKQGLFVLCAAAILVGLYLTSLYSYLLFHTVSELFTVAIAFAMFIIVWNSRQFIEDNYLSFIGIAFLFIGSLDLVHTLAYKGMGVFQGYNPDIATQLWIASRYLHSVSFLMAAFFIRRKLRQSVVAFVYSVITAIVLLSIFYWENFPACFVEGTGLTKFKDISETVICGFFVIAILLLHLNRKQFKKSILAFLIVSLFLSICSELAFTLYGSVYGSANLTGHYFKIISFYLIYRAMVKTQLIDPYSTLFRNLKQHEKFLIEEQKRRESILSAIPDAIYIVNCDYDIEYSNPTMRSIFGEIDGKKCYEYLGSQDKPCSLCKFSEVLDGKTIRWECTSKKTGKVYDAIDTPFVNLHTGQISKLKILHDITEIKQAEQVLCQTKDELEKKVSERTAELIKTNEAVKIEKQRLNEVLEMLPAYAILLTPDYHVAYANRTFRNWFGDDNGKKCYEFLFNRTEPCENCETYKVLKTNKPHHWEWTGPDGRNYDIYDFPFTDTDGTDLVMEMGIDITEQKRTQEALRLASLYSRSLIEASLDPLVTISPDGKITDVNEATVKVTGIDREMLIGTDFSNYFTEPQKASDVYQQVFTRGFVIDYPLTIRHRNGRLTDVLYNASVYTDTGGNIIGVFAAARDITKRKAIERKQGITNSLLELFAAKTSRKEYLDATTKVIKDWSGCEFIGIRIKDDDKNIPYESCIGFKQDFLELENCLNLGRDNCVCVQAILQNYPQHDYITSAKSFFCNDSNIFLKNLADEQKKKYRGNCMKFGFQSITVVPIRYHNEIFGAIHIADFKKDMVSLAKVQFIESTVAPLIGEAINRFNAEAELRKHRLHLEDIVKQRTQELRESEEDLNRAQAVSHIGSWRMDVQQNVLTWSDENHRIFGIPKGVPMTYETFLSMIHLDDKEMVGKKWLAALKGEPYDIEHRIVVDGQIKWVREIADLEFDKNGVLLGGFGTTEDITDRKNYEEQINSLAKFPSENPFAVLRVESDGKIVYANNAGVDLLKFWQRKLGQNVPADWQELIDEALKIRRDVIKEAALDGSVVSFAITPIHDSGYVNIYGRYITEYKNTEKKLQEINSELEARVKQRTKQLQELVNALQSEVLDRIKAENGLLENQDKLRLMSQELVLAEERERRELATQLHDSIGQLLSFSKKELGALSRNAPETLKSSLEKVWELIKQAVEQTRTLTFDLSSATLYTIGLEEAIEELAEDFAKDHGFKLHFSNDENLKPLTEQFKVLLYRAVRELLINISKHSNAHNVYIDIRKIKDSICIIVKDDGVGLDIAGLESKKGKLKGFGLFSIQERLANIGGSFDIKSKSGSGMTVKLTAPLAESKGE